MTMVGKPGLVSIVVASYNHAEFLDRRMETLLSQTYPAIEILVIEDCSSDDSLAVLRKYEHAPKVKLIIREHNGGWLAVSRQGIEMSSGEFVIFAQCDDDCDPRLIERLVDGMQANPSAGVAFCRSLLVDKAGHELGDDFSVREPSFRTRCVTDTLLTRKEMSRFLLHSCVIPNMSAALIRRECFSVIGHLSTDYPACNDWDLFFRIVTRYDVAYIAEPLNRFRQHETTMRNVTKGRVTYEEFFRLLLGQIRLLDLTFVERCRFRMHVMYLWAMHLLSPSLNGLQNFPYHLKRVLSLDPPALIFLVPSMILRLVRMLGKALSSVVMPKDKWIKKHMNQVTQ
jgi:glycosyltransferase involved in cell wall biosynthesis